MKRLLFLIFFLYSSTFLCNNTQSQEAPIEMNHQQKSKKSATVTMSSSNQPFVLTDNPNYQVKQQRGIPLPIEQIPQDLLYTLDDLQANNPRHFQRELRRWIKWLNPVCYIPQAQEMCESHIDFLFSVLLLDHIEDVQSRPNISSADAQAIESTFNELFSVEIPICEDEQYLLEIHKPFKYPLYALLFSLLESKTLSLHSYTPALREKRAHFFNSMFTQVVKKMHKHCHYVDIEINDEVEEAIQGNLTFILPTALKAIKRNHCDAYQGGESWWSYLYDSLSTIGYHLNKTIKYLIIPGIIYLILKEDRHLQQQIQNLNGNEHQQAIATALTAAQSNSLKIIATLIPAALPYLLNDSETTPPRRPTTVSYGYRNTNSRQSVSAQRGWLS